MLLPTCKDLDYGLEASLQTAMLAVQRLDGTKRGMFCPGR